MEVNTKDIMNKEKRTDKVNILGEMAVILLEIGKIIKSMELGYIIGQMEDSIVVIG